MKRLTINKVADMMRELNINVDLEVITEENAKTLADKINSEYNGYANLILLNDYRMLTIRNPKTRTHVKDIIVK